MRNPFSASFWKVLGEIRSDLHAYARSISDSADRAEDLVSDAIERAAKAEKRPKNPGELRPWMFRIIRNLNVDELRKRRVRREYYLAVARLQNIGAWRNNSLEDELAIRQAFEGLDAKHREVLFLVDIMGMTYSEAAEVMSVPTGTVMSRISRARKSLLARFDDNRVVTFRKDAKRQ